jgi:hypothetical protein
LHWIPDGCGGTRPEQTHVDLLHEIVRGVALTSAKLEKAPQFRSIPPAGLFKALRVRPGRLDVMLRYHDTP